MTRTEKWIVGNWKMNGTMTSCRDLASDLAAFQNKKPVSARVILCPSFPYLDIVALRLMGSSLDLGAQDCSVCEDGAFTGQVSAAMLKDLSCSFVILGHSERRSGLNEKDGLVFQKAQRALAAGLTPIICIGESLEEREAGKAVSVVLSQVRHSIPSDARDYLIAYEPVWAIGTGKTPTSAQIREIHEVLAQEKPSFPLLYGGSVKANNALEILSIPHVDGLLVGGASLHAVEFWNIVQAADACHK